MPHEDSILETRRLTKSFRGFTAVSDVNLRVNRGSIHALIGPNGAGKTTCFNLLTKFLEPTTGTILFNGIDITREKPAQIARRGVIRSFQISAVFPHLTVLENVRIGAAAAARHVLSFLAQRERARHAQRARHGAARSGRPDRRSRRPRPSTCRMAASARWRSPPRWRWSRS
ncbi:ATP-binding cassette domain-containing protein [Cupriavidus basilensis]